MTKASSPRSLEARIANAVPGLIAYIGADERYRFVNETYRRWFGVDPESLIGRKVRSFVGESSYRALHPHILAALGGESQRFVTEVPRGTTGATRWIEAVYTPEIDENGRVLGFVSFISDVTAQKRSDDRVNFLVEAGALLGQSLDYQETLRNVAKLAVPRFADWCSIHLRESDGSINTIILAHADPEKLEAARAFVDMYPSRPDEPLGIANVIRTGKAEFYPDLPEAFFLAIAHDEQHLQAVRMAGMRSAIIVPLTARGRTFGGVALITAESGHVYTEADLAIVQELADRAAVAVDNAALYESAEQNRRAAEEASRLKDEFLATVSHELRTPLSAILGWSLMLNGKADPASLAKGLTVIERNARSQLRIIEDILDVSRIIRGELRIETDTIDLLPIAREVVDALGPAVTAKDITLNLECTEDECRLVGDPERLRQIIWNLLSNAVKFTPTDGTIALSLEKAEGRCHIRVRDTGKGITTDFLPHVFERFRQADGGANRKSGGVGLGLAIVRHLAELHGGTVRAESEGLGQGSTFTVSLPVKPFTGPLPPRAEPADTRPLANKRILVVEDDDDARELIELLLTGEGAMVRVAASAVEALAFLEAQATDVLVSDIAMPDHDGYWLIERVRRKYPDLPAIALTAFTRREDCVKVRAAGYDQHLGKPVEPERLVRAIAASSHPAP